MDIFVRNEQETDYRRVEEIAKAAFSYPERIARGGIGCPYEHWMVHELRKRDGIPELSLVAEADGVVVGHIICSKAEIRLSDDSIPVLNFGPLSVLPEYQRQGVGKALIESMICKATELGFGAILFFGRPEYYPQFGFKEASTWGIMDPNGYNYPAFMGMELVPGYLSHAKGGRFYESDIYDDSLNRKQVKAFDQLYKVVTLCGSTKFKDEFIEQQKLLTLQGYIVISVGFFEHSCDDVWTEGTKEMLDDMHKRKIDMADEIFVINKDGYIGSSTKSEIEYARARGIPVRYLEN